MIVTARLSIGLTVSSSHRLFSMLVRWEWDESLQDILEDERLPETVSEVLRAHRLGHHLVVMERKVALALGALGLARADIALLKRLASEFTQTGGLHQRSDAYLSIQNSFHEAIRQNGARVEVSLGTIRGSRLMDPTLLVVENVATDGWLLEQVLSVVATRTRLGAFKIETVHGGGDDIANVVDALLSQKRASVVIVDSDKNTPLSPPTPKIGRLERSFQRHNWVVGRVDSPPCRELENLIPRDVLVALPSGVACGANHVLLQISDAEERSSIAPLERLDVYFDLKLGISADNLQNLPTAERSWFESKFDLIGLDKEDFSIPGYGERIVNQIKAEGRHISDFRSSLSQREWAVKFLGFFSEILWYFISNRRLVT